MYGLVLVLHRLTRHVQEMSIHYVGNIDQCERIMYIEQISDLSEGYILNMEHSLNWSVLIKMESWAKLNIIL
jgi:hypothetical protein